MSLEKKRTDQLNCLAITTCGEGEITLVGSKVQFPHSQMCGNTAHSHPNQPMMITGEKTTSNYSTKKSVE